MQAQWQLNSSWSAGYVAQLRVSADAARSGWQVSWADPAATSVANAWGMTCSIDADTLSCVGADWAKELTPGQPVTVGVQVNSPGPAPVAPKLTVS